jgi:hypothetical protein
MVMAINVTFNNISVISGRLVLLVEETTNLLQAPDKLYHIMRGVLDTTLCDKVSQ